MENKELDNELLDKIGKLLIYYDLKDKSTLTLNVNSFAVLMELENQYNFKDANVRHNLIVEFLKCKEEWLNEKEKN